MPVDGNVPGLFGTRRSVRLTTLSRSIAPSTIEWTESTWNPVTGCDDASPGCENCYARRMARRLEAMGAYNYRNGFRVTLQPQMLDRPLRWRKPQRVFVNSMSDPFPRRHA